jgi:poly(hydroxyalkanoate) depolymerase family esterase
MRNLSDTISRLAAFRTPARGAKNIGVVDRLSDLAEFGANPGALRARIYAPESLRDGAPLVVVLHGCTQTAAAYDHGSGWSRLADRQGFALLFPEQTRANNPNLCFNWFAPEDYRRDSGESLSIRGMIETLVARLGVDRKRVFITGLSAGGAMTSAMLAAYPEVFAGGAIIAGLPYGCASTVPEAFDRMRGHGGPSERNLQSRLRDASHHNGPWPTLSVWHGTADRTVAPSNMEAIIAQWRAVLRLGAAPTCTTVVDGFPRRVWRNEEGREVVEAFSITGMGHGTPLATGGADGYGVSGPFMLDVGVSSTLQIARFWGLAPSDASAPARAAASGALAASGDTHTAPMEAETPGDFEGEVAAPSPAGRPATGIKKTIEDALRAAGLMR